jgi:DNA-directed RNA polymerase sigma subunit (sigma70/sigma32)
MADISELPDITLVNKVKENACSESFNELSRRHSKLFYKICQNYIKVITSFGLSQSDVFEEKDIVIFEAILKFNPDRGALFSTWLGNYTRYFCLNKINAGKKMPEVAGEEEIEAVFNNRSVEDYEGKAPTLDFEVIMNTLSDTQDNRIIDIFRLRYDPDRSKKRTWANIAQQLCLTVQTTIVLHKKGLALLREAIVDKKLDIYC